MILALISASQITFPGSRVSTPTWPASEESGSPIQMTLYLARRFWRCSQMTCPTRVIPGGATRRAPVVEISYVQQACVSRLAISGKTFTGTARCRRFSRLLSAAVAVAAEAAVAEPVEAANGIPDFGSIDDLSISARPLMVNITFVSVCREPFQIGPYMLTRCIQTSYNETLDLP